MMLENRVNELAHKCAGLLGGQIQDHRRGRLLHFARLRTCTRKRGEVSLCCAKSLGLVGTRVLLSLAWQVIVRFNDFELV